MRTSRFLRALQTLSFPIALVLAQAELPAWPLAGKAPFFNSWYGGGSNSAPLPFSSPRSWSFQDMGWFCVAIVDGVAFRLMGAGQIPSSGVAQQLSLDLTATRTTFSMQAGPVMINLTFFTPVTPTDLVRQSIPFSYLYATIVSSDSSTHSVKIYSDILSDWVTGNASLPVSSDAVAKNGTVILSSRLQVPQAYTTVNGAMYDGTVYYATSSTNTTNVTYQIGTGVRDLALNSTGLLNTVQSSGSSSLTNEMGMLLDLGEVSKASTTIVWAIGFYRNPAVQYIPLSGDIQLRSSYFLANFSDPTDVVSFVLNDFDDAVHTSDLFDAQISDQVNNVSSTYSELVLPVIRQVMATVDITISQNADGSWNTSDVFAFMYDLGLAGFNGPNPVDMLFAAFPAFLYLNPALAGFLLRPMFDLQDAGLYTQPYPAINLGLEYPNVTVRAVSHNFGIETSAGMIIMALAHFKATGDTSIISQHYGVLNRWSDYLVDNTMNPGNQCEDVVFGFHQPCEPDELSLKGIIGIAAMANISKYLGNTDDSSQYQANAASFMKQWEMLATSEGGDRLLSAFEQETTGGLIYNLYADKLLQFDLVPESVHKLQTSFYKSQFSTSSNGFGMPVDLTVPNVSRADWILLSAAAVTDNATRDDMFNAVHLQ